MQLSVMEKFIKGGEGIEKLLKVGVGARTRVVDDKIRCGKGRTAGISGYNHPMLGTGGSFCSDEHGFSFFEHAVNTAEILKLSKNTAEFERVMKPVLDLFRPEREGSTLLDMCPEFFAAFQNNDE